MAKYTVNHKCGHQVTVELYGAQADRAKRISWMEADPCKECLAAAALSEAAELGLPSLSGSVKQVAWATQIMTSAVGSAVKVYGIDKSKAVEIASRYTSAAHWIDTKMGGEEINRIAVKESKPLAKITRSMIMAEAWKMCKALAREAGQSVRLFIGHCLSSAWAQAKQLIEQGKAVKAW